ncbi:hypothetical protein Droror1_Dr00005774 [Drosera rotundifolia]
MRILCKSIFNSFAILPPSSFPGETTKKRSPTLSPSPSLSWRNATVTRQSWRAIVHSPKRQKFIFYLLLHSSLELVVYRLIAELSRDLLEDFLPSGIDEVIKKPFSQQGIVDELSRVLVAANREECSETMTTFGHRLYSSAHPYTVG